MKKSFVPAKIKDHICPEVYKAQRGATLRAEDFYADSSPPKLRRRISYIPDVIPPQKVEDPPRLFIRGLLGGSIDIDLRRLGIKLSEAAFGHWVADESLKMLHVHRGDIAIIDCTHRILREGHLFLLELRGREVLRRLRRRHRIWYLETADGTKQDPVPLIDQTLQGAVVGFLRLFTKVKPIRYGERCGNLGRPVKMQWSDARLSNETGGSKGQPSRSTICRRSSAKQGGVVLAAEETAPYHPTRKKKKRR